MKNMTKLPLALFLVLIAGISGAQAQTMLKVRLTDNSRINVAVDGRYFNKTGTSVTVGDLPPGRHSFRIYAMVQDRHGRGHQEVIYSGKVVTHDGYVTLFTYDANADQPDIQEQDISSYTPPVNNDAGNYGNNINRQPYPRRQYDNNDNYSQPATPSAPPAPTPTLTDTKASNLKALADAKKTDTEKMSVLKDGLNGEKMSTNQVGAIMDWFNFESTKVDFAKWAYPNTVDPENYSTLDSKFTYKNYEDDFDNFLKSNGK